MELIQSKSLLAKLMATENLTIEQRKVQTACFDVQNRVLVVPMLDKNISGQLYDLFMGHEVGHALYTPLEGLQEAKRRKLSLSVANVVEDARIERKIKSKYPGIRSSFIKGYNELISKDFFGTNGFDLNDMNFIDRANLFFKGGAQQAIRFNDEEKLLIQDIENTESYDNVLTVTKKVMEYLKAEKEEKSKNHVAPKNDEEDGDEEDGDPWYDDIEDIDGESIDNYDEDYTPPEDDSNKDGSNDSAGDITQGSGEEQEIESETDKNYHKNESKLFADDNRSYYYGNIPEVKEHYIVSYKKLWPRYRKGMEEVSFRYCDDKYDNLGVRPEIYKKVRNDAKKIVSYLAKEFEMRKNADQLKRATVAKTGDLNMSKLFSYKFNEDIFKKISVIPGGKSHGLVMFIDWSGSMTEHLDNTVKQLINLTMFCKKVNIPFEVYAFTQSYWDEDRSSILPERTVGNIKLGDFRLMNVFSSKMSASEYSFACSAMLYMSELRNNRYRNSCPDFMELSGTPLNEAIIAAMEIIPKFQKQYKLQIVNTVFLTDGDGHRLTDVYFDGPHGISSGDANSYEESGVYNRRSNRVFTIRDPKTRNEEIVTEFTYKKVTTAYLKLLKARTGCNVIGFYILSGRDFNKSLRDFYDTASSLHIENIKSEFRKSKNHVITNAGYDEYYLIKSNSLDIDEDIEFEVKENSTTRGLATAFSKFAGNRISNRIVLNRFIGMIA
jgi:hypothetical protein